MANRLRIPLLAAALLAAAGPARADWLVTTDGGLIETKGPWKVDGRRVVFQMPNGTLSSVRSDEVDLDRSAAETARAAEAARRAAEPAPEPKREPVMRLTEKDIPPSTAVAEEGEEGEAGTAEGAAAAAAVASGLEVISWDKTATAAGDGLEIFGTIKNNSPNNITSPSLMVMIYGADGGLMATNEGTINVGMIPAGKTANFRAAFPGVHDFSAAKFDAQGRGFRAPTPEPGSEGAAAPEPEAPEATEEEPPSE
ncbi:MAG: hypothetical protein H6Q02_1807 [Acidobacteria bacterium]|nr:hypothetical protein [Acidobacteriota bacterium]